MTILVAGSQVKLGDRLYSRRAGTIGTVSVVRDGSISLEVGSGSSGRTYTVTTGGFVSGIRDVFWHEPLTLDLPKDMVYKVAKLQTVIDTLVTVL